MLNPMNLNGKTILITGASSGLGRETAIMASEMGGSVVLVGRNEKELCRTLGMLNGKGHVVEFFDLNDIDAIPKWIKKITENTGPLNGLVHSAGIISVLPINLMTRKRTEQIMNINFNASVALARAFKQKNVCADIGSIVFLSSVAGLIGEQGLTVYSASKGAIISMCRGLAIEFSKIGIRVNCVAPGYIMTNMGESIARYVPEKIFAQTEERHLLGLGSPRDVANSIVFLLADTGRWITGSTLVVDGGYSAH